MYIYNICYLQFTQGEGTGKTLLPVGGVTDEETQDTLHAVVVWLGVVIVCDKRWDVDVITREDDVDGLAVVVGVVTEMICVADVAAVGVTKWLCITDDTVVVVVVIDGFCIADSAIVVCGDTEGLCIADIAVVVVVVVVLTEGFCIADIAVVVGVVTGVANTTLFDDTFTEVKSITEEICV
jgi:hypothetical protein